MLDALFRARDKMSASYAGDGMWLVQFEAMPPLPGPGVQIWRAYERLAAGNLLLCEPDNDLAEILFKYFYEW